MKKNFADTKLEIFSTASQLELNNFEIKCEFEIRTNLSARLYATLLLTTYVSSQLYIFWKLGIHICRTRWFWGNFNTNPRTDVWGITSLSYWHESKTNEGLQKDLEVLYTASSLICFSKVMPLFCGQIFYMAKKRTYLRQVGTRKIVYSQKANLCRRDWYYKILAV